MDWIKEKNVYAQERISIYVTKLRWEKPEARGVWLDPNDNGEKYDFRTSDGVSVTKHEVKADWASEYYPNAYLEIENTRQQKKSGVMVTEADYWWHYLPKEKLLVSFDPKVMRNDEAFMRCANGQYNAPGYDLSKRDGGDRNSLGVKIRKNTFRNLPFVNTYPFTIALLDCALQLGITEERFNQLEMFAKETA